MSTYTDNQLEALENFVIVRRVPTEEKNSSGLIIPNGEIKNEGFVVSVGPGKYATDGSLIPMRVSPGDKVLFARHGHESLGEEYTDDDGKVWGELLLMRDSDIRCRINSVNPSE